MVIVCRIESVDHRARVSKLLKVLLSQGAEVVLWKLRSSSTELPPVPEIPITHARRGALGKVVEYLIWMVNLYLYARQAPSADCYWCVGLDSAIPIAVARVAHRQRMVFDHADNLSKSYFLPPVAKRLIEQLERWVAREAQIHLVPSEVRWPAPDRNRRVVPNLPSRLTVQEAVRIAEERGYQRPRLLTVYVNGWLTATRGLAVLSDAMVILQRRGTPLRVLVAGGIGGPEANGLIEDVRTEYFGTVSNAEALALYFRASIVFTYYDPRIEINRLAEPNKWGDCIATHTPFICNEEIATARNYTIQGCCVSLPYNDSAGLARVLEELAVSPSSLDKLNRAVASVPVQLWDDHIVAVAAECVWR